MNTLSQVVKCRTLIGRLEKRGLIASRRTFSSEKEEGPDALIAAQDGRAWLTLIWPGETLQSLLWQDESTAPIPGLDSTAQCLIRWRDQHTTGTDPRPSLLVIAPALDREELPGGRWPCGAESIPVITRQACGKGQSLANAILNLIGPILPSEVIAYWRGIAVPEVRIDTPRRRQPVVRDTHSVVAPLLLDYKQERCARLDLDPDPGVRVTSGDLGIRVVTGVAGCGKTLVLVHRAALLANHFPQSRVLIASHNKPLIRDLDRRVRRLKAAERIECRTFYSWLAQHATSPGEMLKPHEVKRWIARERQALALVSLDKFSDEWLAEEIGWMFDHDQAGPGYLKAIRKGRGIPLSVLQRREVLTLAQGFRTHLRQSKQADWSEWPLFVFEQKLPAFRQPIFDHLLIDEAQFFAPVWLRLLTGVLKPGGHLFICADPTQGFLRRRTSWIDIGLDVRRRGHRLEKPYRSTRAILEFARDFYQRRLPHEDEPLNLPAPEWMRTIEPGVPPIVQPGGAPQDQINQLIQELTALRDKGTPFDDILILIAGQNTFEKNLVSQLNHRLGPGSAASMKDRDAPDDSLSVTHLMSATGLERPIVFLLGLDELVAQESDPTLTPEERAEKRLANTRLIYVGLTRAMERLVVYSNRLRSAFGIADQRTLSA